MASNPKNPKNAAKKWLAERVLTTNDQLQKYLPNKYKYVVAMEIEAPFAMWTRPDTGDPPVSEIVPSGSAVVSIFESVLRILSVTVVPLVVVICRPVQFLEYCTNYRGPHRDLRSDTQQIRSTILDRVCYKFFATLDGCPADAHEYQHRFLKRLQRRSFFYMPYLGVRGFVPDYVGFCRNETYACLEINKLIPQLLFSHDAGKNMVFIQDVNVVNGVLCFRKTA